MCLLGLIVEQTNDKRRIMRALQAESWTMSVLRSYFNRLTSRPPIRRHRRIELEAHLTMRSDDNIFMGFSENISQGGVFVATPEAFEIGKVLTLHLHLPSMSKPITALAEVRWTRPGQPDNDVLPGVGCQFVRIEGTGDEVLRDFIETREPMFFEP